MRVVSGSLLHQGPFQDAFSFRGCLRRDQAHKRRSSSFPVVASVCFRRTLQMPMRDNHEIGEEAISRMLALSKTKFVACDIAAAYALSR